MISNADHVRYSGSNWLNQIKEVIPLQKKRLIILSSSCQPTPAGWLWVTLLFTLPTGMYDSSYHAGISPGITDVSNVQYQVCLVYLVQYQTCGIQGWLLSTNNLQTLVSLTNTHIYGKETSAVFNHHPSPFWWVLKKFPGLCHVTFLMLHKHTESYAAMYNECLATIRESVDSLRRDGANAQYIQYLSKCRINFTTNTLKVYLST